MSRPSLEERLLAANARRRRQIEKTKSGTPSSKQLELQRARKARPKL